MKAVFAAALLCMAASRSHAEVIWVRYASATKVSLYGSYAYTQFNVNLGVWPVTAGHRVGVVSTTDGWRTVKWTDARWQCNLPNAYGSWDEQWNALENLAAPQAAQIGRAHV